MGKTKWAWFTIVILMAAVLLFSCTATKQVSKSSIESNELKEKEDSIRLLLAVSARLEEENRQLKYAGVTFQDRCDTNILRRLLTAGLVDKSVIDMYLNRIAECKDEVEITSDGTLKAKGQLKDAVLREEGYKKRLQQLELSYDSLAKSKQKEVFTEVVREKDVEVKVEVFPWYFWIITGGFALLWLRKQFTI